MVWCNVLHSEKVRCWIKHQVCIVVFCTSEKFCSLVVQQVSGSSIAFAKLFLKILKKIL